MFCDGTYQGSVKRYSMFYDVTSPCYDYGKRLSFIF